MTRILVQRGSASSPSNQSRSSSTHSGSSSSSSSPAEPQGSSNTRQVLTASRDEEITEEKQEQVSVVEHAECSDVNAEKVDNMSVCSNETVNKEDDEGFRNVFGSSMVSENVSVENEGVVCDSPQSGSDSPHPPPPPVPSPKPFPAANPDNRRSILGSSNALRIGTTQRGTGSHSVVPTKSSQTGSRPPSPRPHSENDGYNSADEHNPCFVPSYSDLEGERQFEYDLRRAKGLEVRRMAQDGNCLFRAVADQVYGDSEAYDLIRQMCMDYMERERDHFSQFITEGFTTYLKRKRRDKVYGNNVEIQALAEMYNRPIHIYSYSTEPINIFQGNYNTDMPPIRLSYHNGNHYNSLVDPHRLTVGAGLGFSSLRGRNVDREQVKAAIKAQQDQQIDNALLSEGKFYSDLELTEREIERSVMEASRAEFIMERFKKPQLGPEDSSTSTAEPSSSEARPSGSKSEQETKSSSGGLSSSIQTVLSMGFGYMQAMEAYSIFGEDVDSMVCYLLEMSSGRQKGKAAE
ncbi:PREDICTED: OTU domain-containing protein 5-like isoform X2 [Tarenaya hassleriana]|uniref:OTU domain-containing protein 5-like isoform X1 n=1 Tax=Tarenaya hassleriana TaxID=28532 RepID=UPI00053C45E5|nr:PREDICTED: OTU domain-containing protein 5-like isoform X1 [Tarenaya hassleriana]XP_010557428.1 PREDICTED: OTU domain-containing protein 5-like isoform X2 [Tarenaya hassleriana]